MREITALERNFEGCEGWIADPYAYDQAVLGIVSLLETFRPNGKIVSPPNSTGLPAETFSRMGEGFARETLSELASPDSKGPAWPFAYGADAIRERLADLISVVGAEPGDPTKTEQKPARKGN